MCKKLIHAAMQANSNEDMYGKYPEAYELKNNGIKREELRNVHSM